MPLVDFYRDVLQAEPALAECYAAAATVEGLHDVADLEAAEANPELAGRLSVALDACSASGG